ncbi:MAG: orotate phosphoribosyltransferase [Planctomycetota bacterium]
MSNLEADKAKLLELIKRDAFKTGDFTLASGAKSNYYIDGRLLTLSSDGVHVLARVILAMIKGDEIDAVGGMTMGADPIIGAVLALADANGRKLNGFICRKERKDHGTARLVEGNLAAGNNVLMVEDVVTSGGSTLRAIDAVQELGGEVVRVIAMVDRLAGAANAFAERGCNFTPIFTVRDLGIME